MFYNISNKGTSCRLGLLADTPAVILTKGKNIELEAKCLQ